jgi:multiple sugar transport system substrate-binding protein
MRSNIWRPGALFIVVSLLVAACGGQGAPPTTPGSDSTAPAEESPPEEAVEIRWFCCLGAGDDIETQQPTERRIVEEFNASHPNINLVIEIVDYDEAFDTMSVQVAGGNAPDIVGPVGVSGAEAFHGQWLDLTDLIEANDYDLSQFPEEAVEFYQVGGEGQIGIPFAQFPSMLYYQRDMFDEAGLEYPPHEYGEPYVLDGEEVEWNFETLRELALRLTVDVNGNDATSPDFDPANIVQYGYEPQFQDLRAVGSYFGAGSMADGTTAQIPDPWQDAWRWLYQGIWEDHFIMTETLVDAPEFGNGNAFQSGHVAMALSHLWYTCCVSQTDEENNPIDPNWDIAVVPSHEGETTSNLNADTFRIWKETEHPQEAFEVLTYLLGEASGDLLQIYGGLPALEEHRGAFIETLNERWTQDVDWQVAIDGLQYPDVPSFEAWVPNYQEVFDAVQTFGSKLRTEEGLDIEAEIESFQEELQTIFDSAE